MVHKQDNRLSRYGEPAYLILLSLASGPKHGYAMLEDIYNETDIRLGPGTLYGAQTKLLEKGLIKPVPNESGTRRPYAITTEGRQVLEAYMTSWSRITNLGLKRLSPDHGNTIT